ncbi:MAG: TrmB family transcriptional regulator [Planctomycetes bacterium]|nr:TrmB family transcriptional regulator [Planctomycetota bacterium]
MPASVPRSSRGLAALHDLGFTEIETLVYACLLRESPATGYRISHAIGRPTPNTYKAIGSLAQKGAVVVDDGGSRLCRAVPPDELLTALERRFQERKARARGALEALKPVSGDDRVWQLSTVDQVLERARAMLLRTRRMALLDVFPGPFAALRAEIERAARKARVVAKVYAPGTAGDARLVESPDAARVLAVWPGHQLTLVRDAEEHLLALLTPDMSGVHQAVWSNSTFLSCMHHNHVASEIGLTESSAAPLVAEISLTRSGVSGLRTLLERFGPAAATEAPKKGSQR